MRLYVISLSNSDVNLIECKSIVTMIKDINPNLVVVSSGKKATMTTSMMKDESIRVVRDKRLDGRDTTSLDNDLIPFVDPKIYYNLDKRIIYDYHEGFRSVMDRVSELLDELKMNYQDDSVLLLTDKDISLAIYAIINNIIDEDDIINHQVEDLEVIKYHI